MMEYKIDVKENIGMGDIEVRGYIYGELTFMFAVDKKTRKITCERSRELPVNIEHAKLYLDVAQKCLDKAEKIASKGKIYYIVWDSRSNRIIGEFETNSSEMRRLLDSNHDYRYCNVTHPENKELLETLNFKQGEIEI